MSHYMLEVCAANLRSAINAAQAGATRIELCSALPEGGLTPSPGVLTVCRALLPQLKINVMIRPRGGDFVYDKDDIACMLTDIKFAKAQGADGLVFGCLTTTGEIDLPTLELLMQASAPLPITFHRAFDLCRDPFLALEQLIEAKVTRVLTSGQAPQALLGAHLIARLQEKARGRIILMPGAGINAHNIVKLATLTHCQEFHLSAKKRQPSPMRYRKDKALLSGTYYIDEHEQEISDSMEIAAALQALNAGAIA